MLQAGGIGVTKTKNIRILLMFAKLIKQATDIDKKFF